MVDIDLEFLEFLVNPSYEYLANDIKIIQNAYLEMADDGDKKRKQEYFKGVNYLFLQTPEEVYSFIDKFYFEVIYDVYNRLFKLFSINIDNEFIVKDNNFIDSIFLSKGLKDYTDDIDLTILKSDIRGYLINVTLNSQNKRDIMLADKAINEIDSMLEKFSKIESILDPRMKQAMTILDKKKVIRDDLRRDFILEYDYLLSDKGKKFIRDNDDYDVLSFLAGEKLFCKYFYFDCSDVFLAKDIDDDNNLEKRVDDVSDYNEMYNQSVDEYKYMDSASSLFDRIERYVTGLVAKKFPYSNNQVDEMDICNLCDVILDNGDHDGSYLCFGIPINNVIIFGKIIKFHNLKTVEFKKHKFISRFYNTLCHEIGHNFDFGFIGYHLIRNYNLNLYDVYNEYRAEKLFLELVNSGNFNKNGISHCIRLGGYYSDRLFMLLDLFENYKDYFDEYVLKGDERPLRNLFGDENFEKLLKMVNELKKPSDLLIKRGIIFGNRLDKMAKRKIKMK